LLAGLEEFDRRRLYLGLGFTSMYAYCREELHLTDGAAYRRIEVARASRRFPVLLDMLREGQLSLATACLIAPKLEPGTADGLLREAVHKSKREVEAILAARHPQPPVLRRLPEIRHVAPVVSPTADVVSHATPLPAQPPLVTPTPPPSRRPIVTPLSEAHYKLQVTISAAARQRLGQIQDLMRHRLPSGDPAAIVEHALEVLHAELLKTKAAEVARPRGARESVAAKGRHIPASVKRAVWRRDQGRCAFVGETGRRCGAAGALEFHHVDAYAHGGNAIVANIEMRCRAHNGFEWEREVGAKYEAAAPALK
jgi:hypothetical protein